jgi:hypothetical protein
MSREAPPKKYKVLAECETFITIQDPEEGGGRRILKVPKSQASITNRAFSDDFTLSAEVSLPIWCEGINRSIYDEDARRIVVIVDIDGTLSDCSHRVHLAQAAQWDEFHALAPDDLPKGETVEVVKAMQAQGYVVLGLTGRSDRYAAMTASWMMKHEIPLDYFFMRPNGNRAKDCDLKPKMLVDIFGNEENVREKVLVVLEDRDRVVEAFRGMGLKCWQVQAGGY